MRPRVLLLSIVSALFAAACSSSSNESNAGPGADGGPPIETGPSHHHDSGSLGKPATPDASDDGDSKDADHLPSVCSPPGDAATDAGEGGSDAATDAVGDGPVGASDAKVTMDAALPGAEGGSDAAKDAPVLTCSQACIANNPAAYKKYLAYQLTECGCTADGACYAKCVNSTTTAASSACGTCLSNQTAEGLASTCTLAAATDCSDDPTCTAYQACAGMCPM